MLDKEGRSMNATDRRRSVVRRRTGSKRMGTRRKPASPQRDRRRLIQLLVSLGLFLLVFVGRGVFPEQIQIWERLLTSDADIQEALQSFQQSLAQGGDIQTALGQLGASMLGGQVQSGEGSDRPVKVTLLSQTSRLGLDYAAHAGVMAALAPQEETEETPEPEASEPPEPEPTPEIVTAVAQAYTDDGVALPANVSFAYYELGLEETAVPVQGTVTSTFGYRDNPIDGDHEFHLALDIGAAEGTEIGAFADGVVEYIGESDEFGLYLKIRHANNVASFYAHCSKLLVSKGDEVTCGQTVALVGETGNATGPHLHLTIEKDDIRLDPAYYVDLS